MSGLGELSGKIIDLTIHGISEDTFKQVLADLTTTIANMSFNEQYTVDNIYDHIEFIDGDITEVTLQTMRKKTAQISQVDSGIVFRN